MNATKDFLKWCESSKSFERWWTPEIEKATRELLIQTGRLEPIVRGAYQRGYQDGQTSTHQQGVDTNSRASIDDRESKRL